jgi:small subunit ribosomal protein S3Ae
MARARRRVDTWKTKRWYEILAPKGFGEVKIGETLASDPSSLIGRTVETTMRELAGDFTKQHIKLKFVITDVKGNQAYTAFKGHALSREYMRSQIRRKSTRVEGVVDVTTKDGWKLRVKTIAIAIGRVQTAQEKAIRRVMSDLVKKEAEEKDLDLLIQEIIQNRLSVNMYRAASKIYPLKRVEVRKVKVLESASA